MENYIGLIAIFGFNFSPVGWLKCDGSLISISDYSTLYALIGTTYGGDGVNTFGLPDFRGRVGVGQGTLAGSPYQIGQMAGLENVTLNTATMPSHTHAIIGTDEEGDTSDPTGAFPAHTSAMDKEYKAAPTLERLKNMNLQMVGVAGSSAQEFSIVQPVLALNYCIAYEGYFPPPNF